MLHLLSKKKSKPRIRQVSIQSERAAREWSTVVDISTKPPSFKLVPLSSPRSPPSKTPKHVIFLTLSTLFTLSTPVKIYFDVKMKKVKK